MTRKIWTPEEVMDEADRLHRLAATHRNLRGRFENVGAGYEACLFLDRDNEESRVVVPMTDEGIRLANEALEQGYTLEHVSSDQKRMKLRYEP